MQIVNIADETSVALRFVHETEYAYSGPVRFGPHRLVLRPRESHFDRIERMEISTTPTSRLHWFQDIYGNVLARAVFPEPAEKLSIRSEFVLRRCQPNSDGLDEIRGRGDEYPVYYSGIEEGASHHYRRSVYPPQVEEIRQWVRSLDVLPLPGNRGFIFETMTRRIHEAISYLRREASGVQSPSETLRLRTGSCRDTAVLMMEAARCIGYASRFVSGYLESENSKVGRGSTHAWTEVYFPDKGWVGYDPSTGNPAGNGHVAVAVSHHPRGVMPISGRFEGMGNRALGMNVVILSERL